ncbi:MAG: hypothetical protein J6J11_09295 [Treponema sp.]|nr:hypothetical protein [Clostridia bacterium]MBP3608494.1 hypothetical protein [Treponema sp.]
MTRFQELYEQILNGLTASGDICTAHPDFRCPVTRPGFSDDFSFILNETVKSVELTPVPDYVLYEILKNLKRNKNVLKISYKKIIEIIDKSEYALSDVFLKSIIKYANDISGNLYVILLNLSNFEESKLVLSELQNQLNNDERLYQVLSILQKQNVQDLQGLTIIKKDIQIEKYKDCFIILNKKDNWKDTLEHEFKHFIQRVCSFDKSLPKIVKSELNDLNSVLFFNHFKSKGFTSNELRQLMNFLMLKTSKTEQHQSITSLIKFFIRKYETTAEKFEINHKMLTIKQIEGLDKNIKIKIRMKWLDSLLNEINSFKVFDYQMIKTYLNDR